MRQKAHNPPFLDSLLTFTKLQTTAIRIMKILLEDSTSKGPIRLLIIKISK